MTPTQKEFRKQMKDLKRQNKLTEDFRATRKRPKIVKRISIISIIFLLWNSFAIYTWVSPFIKSKINNIVNPNNNITKAYIDDETEFMSRELEEYLEIGTEIDKEVNNIIDKINRNYNGETYKKEDIIFDRDRLQTLSALIFTQQNDIKDLGSNYLELISMTKAMLLNLYDEKYIYEGMGNAKENWDRNREQKIYELIKILDKNGINYNIDDSGILTYTKKQLY